MKEFVELRAKICSHLKDNNDEDKRAKDIKKVCHKKTRKFQDYKNFLEAAQIDNKINYLEKNKIDVDSLRKDKKEFINNKLISKT